MRKTFSFIKTKQEPGNSWKKKKHGQETFFPQAELLVTCSRLPLDKFITCLIDGDLSVLIISGKPSPEEVAEAWAGIFSEYLDLNQDNEAKYLLNLQSNISLLNHQITETDTAIFLLSVGYRTDLIQIIEDNGYTISVSEADFENNLERYADGLTAASEQLAPDRLLFETLSKEYDRAVNSKNEEGIVMDRLFFSKILRAIARFCRTTVIRPSELTVEEYVLLYKDMVEYNQFHNVNDETSEAA